MKMVNIKISIDAWLKQKKIHGKEKKIRKLKIPHISQVLTSFAKLWIN